MTGRRLVVWVGRGHDIDVARDHPLRRVVEVALDRPDRLLFADEPGTFDTARSGRVGIRLRTTEAPHVAALLQPDIR